MLYLSLLFQGSLSWVDIKKSLAEVAAKLTGEACEWGPASRRELPAQVGFDSGKLFEEELVSSCATLQLKATHCDGGNPRDGYLHDLRARLLTKNKGELTLSAASYSGLFEENTITVYAATLDDFELVRQAIRAQVGAERDRTMTAAVALSLLKKAHEQGSPLAQKWLDEALAVGTQPYGWSELLRISQELRGKSPALLAKRLSEAPYDESVWRDASEAPPAPLSKELIQHMLSRFAPKLPTDATWRMCEDGVGPGLTHNFLARDVFSRLFPSTEKPFIYSGVVSYFMQWGTGPLPAVRRQDTVPADQGALDYLWGEHADGCVIVWQKRHPSKMSYLGTALCITGGEAFQSRVKEIIAELAPFRWVRTPFDALFSETEPRTLGLIDRGKGRAEQLVRLLDLMKLPAELMEIYHECQCKEVYCEHAKKLDAMIVAHEEATRRLAPARSFESNAVRSVLDSVRYSLHNKTLDFLSTERQIARHRAVCAPRQCFADDTD